jgi:hypothetical protein
MLTRPETNPLVVSIQFRLFDKQLFQPNSKEKSQTFENLSPAMVQVFYQTLGGMAQKFKIEYLRDAMRNAVGCDVIVEILTDKDLNSAKAENEAKITDAIKKSLDKIDPKKSFNFTISDIKFASANNVNPNAKFKNKVGRKNFKFDKLDGTSSIEIEFVDEREKLIANKPHIIKYNRDAWGNANTVTYEYSIYTAPDASYLEKLDKAVKSFLEKNKNIEPFYKSIQAKDYNQALRRACASGNHDLVMQLITFDQRGELNLDLNQTSSNGKTPLDYAIESGNSNLIGFLKLNNALRGDSLHLVLAEIDDNIKGKKSSDDNFMHGFTRKDNTHNPATASSASLANKNPFSIFDASNDANCGRGGSTRHIDEIMQMNRENSARREKERERIMEINRESAAIHKKNEALHEEMIRQFSSNSFTISANDFDLRSQSTSTSTLPTPWFSRQGHSTQRNMLGGIDLSQRYGSTFDNLNSEPVSRSPLSFLNDSASRMAPHDPFGQINQNTFDPFSGAGRKPF